MLFKIINLLYLAGGWFLVSRLNFKWLKKGSWSYVFLGITFASILFLIGLFAFNIPLAFFKNADISVLKAKWYAFPATAIVCFFVSLTIETIWRRASESD